MKIVFSPSKEMRECEIITEDTLKKVNTKEILFLDKTEELLLKLQNFNENEISKIMKLKDKLLISTIKNFKNYSNLNTMSAISLYSGVAYKEIKLDLYKLENFEYLSKNLFIFSAFYGILTPFTQVKKYRLDMTMKLENINLYNFWKEEVNNFLLENVKDDFILNLASSEFSKILDRKKIKKIIDIDFKTYKAGEYNSISSYSKQARGKFLDILIRENINDIANLKEISFDGYKINFSLSDENSYVFTR